jgi:hypothetical protein
MKCALCEVVIDEFRGLRQELKPAMNRMTNTAVLFDDVLIPQLLALDRFSVLQLQGKNPALAGVVVGLALPGRQAFETRLREA